MEGHSHMHLWHYSSFTTASKGDILINSKLGELGLWIWPFGEVGLHQLCCACHHACRILLNASCTSYDINAFDDY